MRAKAPLFILLMALFHTMTVQAHTGLSRSVPENGASVSRSPAIIELAFGADVRLVNIQITNGSGGSVDLEQSRSLAPAKHFAIPVPSLAPGSYQVDWMVMGSDSHKMAGDFTFKVVGEPGRDDSQ